MIDWEELRRRCEGRDSHHVFIFSLEDMRELIAHIDELRARIDTFESNPILNMQRALIAECDKERLRLHEQIARLSGFMQQGNDEINRLLRAKGKEEK